jgi:glyoxylase-like metal-dependent hydrolase (beta-lactamase superfamily II)
VGLAVPSLAAISAVCVWYAAPRRGALSADRVPRLGAAARTVAPGFHILGAMRPSAAYAVETGEGLVLIDTGLDDDAGLVRAQLAQLGLDWRRLRAIFLTHAHGDHTGGAEFLRAMTRAKVHAGRGDAAVLAAGKPREAFFSTFYMPDRSPHPTTVDVALDGGETFELGGVRVHALATPGHTPGSTCYVVERGGLRAFFSGDVIMKLRGADAPRSEQDVPLGTYSAYLAPRYRGDAAAYLATLRRLRALPAPDLLLPGHPAADPRPQSPAISPERWAQILDDGIRDMETLVARFKADGADFLDGTPKELLPGLFYLGDRDGTAVYGFRASSRFVLVDAPGGPGLLEFVKARLGSLGHEPSAPDVVLLTACDGRETAGLGEVAGPGKALVVAPADGITRAAALCPPGTTVVPADELPAKGWFPVSTLPLGGRGTSPVAYRVTWSGKTVLIAGMIPIKVKQEAGVALFDDFQKGRGDAHTYLETLARLRDTKPDLWLPAVPTDGQNANLYDQDWERTLDENRFGIELNRHLLNPPRP